MFIETAKNPRYISTSKDAIDVDVTFTGDSETYGFTAINGNGESHVQAVWDLAMSGALGEIADYVPELEDDVFPNLSMVDFRRKLRGIKVVQRFDEDGNPVAELDGIYEEDILEKIDLIADKELAAEARDYFLYAQYIERLNPWVDILGNMFGITPEEIDTFWVN